MMQFSNVAHMLGAIAYGMKTHGFKVYNRPIFKGRIMFVIRNLENIILIKFN